MNTRAARCDLNQACSCFKLRSSIYLNVSRKEMDCYNYLDELEFCVLLRNVDAFRARLPTVYAIDRLSTPGLNVIMNTSVFAEGLVRNIR